MPLEDLHYLPLLDVSERIRSRVLSPSAVSGVATALGLCFGSLGSDTGGQSGSPRRPAG